VVDFYELPYPVQRKHTHTKRTHIMRVRLKTRRTLMRFLLGKYACCRGAKYSRIS
jgi:hypothetical protein